MLRSSGVRIMVRIGFCVLLVSGYAHVFALLSVVIVTLHVERSFCAEKVSLFRIVTASGLEFQQY